jgi:hypothetical protein
MSFPLMPLADVGSQPGALWEPVGGLNSTFDMRQLSVNENGVWVSARVFSTNNVLRSTNYGSTWSAVPTGSTDVNGTAGSAYGNGLFIVTDNEGTTIHSSPDGLTWTLRVSAFRDNERVSYNDGYFVVGSGNSGGSGAIYGSDNGTSWVYNAQGNVGANSVSCGIYVASLNRTFAAGSQYKYVNAVPTSATAWTGTPTGLSGTVNDVDWSPTATIAVVVASGGVYSSTDLITWTQRVAVSNFYGVAWCDTQFVAVGSAGKIYTSPNGVTWTSRTSGTSNALYGVAHCNGTILVVGENGAVLRSS